MFLPSPSFFFQDVMKEDGIPELDVFSGGFASDAA